LQKSQSRVSQRSKPANFYANMDRGIGDASENKDFPGGQKSLSKSNTISARARGLTINSNVMKKCTDLIKQVREIFQQKQILQEADKVPNMLNSYTECVAELYTIEKNLRDYQY